MRISVPFRFASASIFALSFAAALPAQAETAQDPAKIAAETSVEAVEAAVTSAVTSTVETTKTQTVIGEPAPVSELIDQVSIPYDQFKLDNGLTVLVHEDRKAPIVAISVWYEVGSKHEPKGKTGFAHLFEHLMFNGSENAPGDFFEPLKQIGATNLNGTTWFDRTNYFENVPTGALDRGLMLESDRMGYLLGAVTQETLDNQIGVVQNEKRQGDNQPYGLVEYEQLENLYPSGHPYHHSTIGSMDDLSSATLDDVKQWFRDNYGPNNAVLVLAGDIDTATAKEKVTKWFGAIPSGPETPKVVAPIPDLPEDLSKTIYDKVATPRVYRMWAVPGLDNPDYIPLTAGGMVLGGLASSRLDNVLVRDKKLAVWVVASNSSYAQAGNFSAYADVAPGVDPDVVAAALDAEIAKFIAEGPTQDELDRAVMSYTSAYVRGLEQVGGFSGKAPVLAEGLLYEGDPAAYRKTLDAAAALTPQQVRDVSARWLSRPVFKLRIMPGERKAGGEDRGGFIWQGYAAPISSPAYFRNPNAMFPMGSAAAATAVPEADRSQLPPVETLTALDFPKIERAKLSNGMEVFFARRDAAPVVSVRVIFDAGFAADPKDKSGLQSLMLRLMDEGTRSLDSTQLAVAKERLGAQINGGASADLTYLSLNALTPNLAPSLGLFSEYIRNPAFKDSDLERVRAQQLTQIKSEMNSPFAVARNALVAELFGNHPYSKPPSGTGDPEVVKSLSAQELRDHHQMWLRPDLGKIFVVGDTTLKEAVSLLENSFSDWTPPAVPAPVKSYDATIPTQTSRVILIDRPKSPQSMILGGRVLNHKGTDDLLTLNASNEVYGGGFLSRINMNLRETKGWSYGVGSFVTEPLDRSSFMIYAPVQADKTGDSMVELRKELASYTGSEGATAEELTRLVNGNVRELPGQFETSSSVLGGVMGIITYERPDNYYEALPGRYNAMTTSELDVQAKENMIGDDLVFVVVGDADVVAPQLEQLGLPVEIRKEEAE